MKRGYVVLNFEQKVDFVRMVQTGGKTIKEAAKAKGINYSTAKYIMKQFRTNPRGSTSGAQQE